MLLNESQDVLEIDLDPGQPSHSPPALLSSYVHTRGSPCEEQGFPAPSYSLYFGSISPQHNLAWYRMCVLRLADVVAVEFPNHSLVINTSGWIEAEGLDLLNWIASVFTPTHIVQLGAEGKLFPEAAPVHRMANPATHPTIAKDRRRAKYLDYFRPYDEAIVPYQVPWASVFLHFQCEVLPPEYLVALNGQVVGLLSIDFTAYELQVTLPCPHS